MQDNNTARKKVYDVLRDKTGYSDSYEDFNKFMDENEEARTINQNAFLFEKGISDCRQNRYGFVYFVLGCLTVSYTHLDVYKRQSMLRMRAAVISCTRMM